MLRFCVNGPAPGTPLSGTEVYCALSMGYQLTDWPASVKPILEYLGLPTEPPGVAPARGPPHTDDNMRVQGWTR